MLYSRITKAFESTEASGLLRVPEIAEKLSLPGREVICSGLKSALPSSDFQGSVSCDLKCKELRHKE